VQGVIQCPKCHVPVKRDDLGELLCPNCNTRVCPKAHSFDGKICTYCGWEDPNYQLWQKRQKAQQKSPKSIKSDETTQDKLQYTCPNCGSSVDATHKRCPSCGLLGAKYRPVRATTTSASTTAASPKGSVSPLLDKKAFDLPKKQRATPTKSPFLKEIIKAERRQWEFPSLRRFIRPDLARRFLQPVGAGLLVCLVLGGLVWGGIYITQLISQSFEPGNQPLLPHITPLKTYTLSTDVIPKAGGNIDIASLTSGNGALESGSQVTLTAIPGDCYDFSYWDGAASSTETATITMDSDKSVTAHFQIKDTTPPAISEIKITSYSDISATVTWLTDKPATSEIEYGKTKDYGLSTTLGDALTTNHKVRLTTLQPNTTYHLVVKSADSCGKEATGTTILTTLRKIPTGERVGERAPNFTLPSYYDDNTESPNKGQIVSLSDFQGKKVLVNFWATSCGPCLKESPLIRETYQNDPCNENTGGVAVLTIGIDNQPERIKLLEDKYESEYGRFTFPILLDTKENPAKDAYVIFRVPTTFFIDTDGIIREIQSGRFSSKEEIQQKFDSLD
jgi:thiol-disulfide isomerase/thioredoxin/predicted RNA-binding Zn-ribbon protein involved in translation (DUF1610 family)